jgi:hypothetical protein
MITILMLQLQSFQRLFLVVATGPLAVIGVAAALLISGTPMGFVAILGVISLIGMVIRNSVILIDQIETEIGHGRHPWDAVIVATERRLRPILLTAAAAILGMIPIAPTVFWGPMPTRWSAASWSRRCSRSCSCPLSTWPGFGCSRRKAWAATVVLVLTRMPIRWQLRSLRGLKE